MFLHLLLDRTVSQTLSVNTRDRALTHTHTDAEGLGYLPQRATGTLRELDSGLRKQFQKQYISDPVEKRSRGGAARYVRSCVHLGGGEESTRDDRLLRLCSFRNWQMAVTNKGMSSSYVLRLVPHFRASFGICGGKHLSIREISVGGRSCCGRGSRELSDIMR